MTPIRSAALLSACLSSLLACPVATAQEADGIKLPEDSRRLTPIAPETLPNTSPDKHYLRPALEIIGFDLSLSAYNRRTSGVDDYDVSWSSIRKNLHGPWVTDNDPFSVNQFAHPYQGSLYHNAARANGLSYWEASAYTFAGSLWWEITGEKTPPAKNDQVASGIAGSFFGEPLFRMAHLVLTGPGNVSYFWREIGASAISPAVGFNRLAFGAGYERDFDDHDPDYYGRIRFIGSRATRDDVAFPSTLDRNEGLVDFALDYGLPGKPGYTYNRPFDYFSFQVTASTAIGIDTLATRGLLAGADYAVGDSYRGVWGVYGSYDYYAPQLFRLASTAVSVGSTAQWWASPDVSIQGTALAGLGYSAASTGRAVTNDKAYRYGMAPRLSLALHAVASERFSAEISAQTWWLGRIANRNAGHDDISRLDAALAWRIQGRHAVGVRYLQSRRVTDFPTIGERTQALSTVGIFYQYLGLDGFGAVDWREARE